MASNVYHFYRRAEYRHSMAIAPISLILLLCIVQSTQGTPLQAVLRTSLSGAIENLCGVVDYTHASEAVTPGNCSSTNPKFPSGGPLVLNHVAKRVYFASGFGFMFGHPIPNEGTGRLEIMAGATIMGCVNSDCYDRGPSAVGTFAQTRIILPRALHGAANLHPVYLVLDVRSYRVVAMDVSTSTSSYYMGTGTGSTSAPYNNNPKLSVKLPYAASTMKSDNDYLYLSSSASIVRVSLTTGMVTTTLVFMEGGQAVSKNNNMGLYKGHFFVAPRASTCVVMGPVTNPTLEMSECAWEVEYTADLSFAVPSSGSHLFALSVGGMPRLTYRYNFASNLLEKIMAAPYTVWVLTFTGSTSIIRNRRL
eukprot:PhM_4_TR18760/c4_g4_i8/m.4281